MAGFRTFATGEVLTAANVNNFLMGQSVMRFADATARTAALGTDVVEGMLTYNLATDQLEVFDGSAFIAARAAGIGSNVVSTTKVDAFSTTATFQDVPGLAVTITPTSATSKMLVSVNVAASAAATGIIAVHLFRDSTEIAKSTVSGTSLNNGILGNEFFSGDFFRLIIPAVSTHLDNPETTLAVTYKIQISAQLAAAFVNRRGRDTDRGASSSISVIEVAA